MPCAIVNRKVKFLIDTGASVTVLSSAIYKAIPPRERPELKKPPKSLHLEGADDTEITIDGLATMDFLIGDNVYQWNMYIAPIAEDGLLGMDFLYDNDFVFGAEGGLQLNGYHVDIELEGNNAIAQRIQLNEDIVIPAMSECVAICMTTEIFKGSAHTYITEPIPEKVIADDIHIGSTLIDRRTNVGVPVRLMNTSAEDKILHGGTVVANIIEVMDVVTIARSEREDTLHSHKLRTLSATTKEQTKGSQPWPEPLRDLFERSVTDLSQEHAAGLHSLLDKHIELFAKSPGDLGRTSVATHKIPTGDALPIKQPPRRPPCAFRDEEERIIREQLEAGVIRESTSPWAMRLFTFRKRTDQHAHVWTTGD